MTARRLLRTAASLLCTALMVGAPVPAQAYLKFGFEVGGVTKVLRWHDGPVTYYVNNRQIPNVSASAFQSAVARAFRTWEAVPTATVSYRFGGFTANTPLDDDGLSTLGFVDEPAFDRVLATTSFLVDDLNGELLESDIFFNSAFAWSASQQGVANRWDVETIAVHEIGHFNGLGHSAIGETAISPTGRSVLSTGAVMFPIALAVGDTSLRVLAPDDIAGVSDLYPTTEFSKSTGSISGRVVKDGRGVLGAHIVAFNLSTGSQVGNLSLAQNGEFSIAGLRPGPHLLRVEPLDDAEVESFFSADESIDVNFRAVFHPKVVVVPRSGDSGIVEIVVRAK